MYRSGRVVTEKKEDLEIWDPKVGLEEVDYNYVRFGHGFLLSDMKKWFSDIASDWSPLFYSLEMEVNNVEVEVSLDFPDLDRIVPVEYDGEIGVIGSNVETQKILSQHILKKELTEEDEISSDILIEYLERRLISTLSKAWKGSVVSFPCSYTSQDLSEVEVVGVVKLSALVNSKPISVWFGLGPRVTERLDRDWCHYISENPTIEDIEWEEDDVSSISVDIVELAVPPALIIDYTKVGTVIDLESKLSNKVIIKKNGHVWADGELSYLNGRFVVKISNISKPKEEFPKGSTKVTVEIARVELSRESLIEYSQENSYLLTNTSIGSTAYLVISGERVAKSEIVLVNGNFGISILPK